MLDFPLLVELGLSQAGWGDQIAMYQAIIDGINDRGGINGRNIEAEFQFYSPISATSADEVCTSLTQDFEIFAVIGGFLGPAGGTSDPCITGFNETILVGGAMNQEELDASTAPWYHAGLAVERQTDILFTLLEANGYTEGADVFVTGGVAAESELDYSLNLLAEMGVNVVGTAVLGAGDGDTLAQDDEMGSITERIRESGANTVFIFGNPSASIRGLSNAGMHDDVEIWNNNASGLNNLGATITDRAVANGTLSMAGISDGEIWEQELFQTYCIDPVIAKVPEADMRHPEEYELDEENWFNGARLACQDLALFEIIASASSTDLTPETFQAGADSLLSFEMPTGPESSLGPDKINARDLHRLVVFDADSADGQTVPLTELQNSAN